MAMLTFLTDSHRPMPARRCGSWFASALVSLTTLVALSSLASLPMATGCHRAKTPSGNAPDTTPLPSASVETPRSTARHLANPDAACLLALLRNGADASPGEEEESEEPVLLPAGQRLRVTVRSTGHRLVVQGPASLLPCSKAHPRRLLLAEGSAIVEGPEAASGEELLLATHAFVVLIGAGRCNVRATESSASYQVEDGTVTITTLDDEHRQRAPERRTLPRYEDGPALWTRCNVQASAAHGARRLVHATGPTTDAALPAPSASILAARVPRIEREAELDCAFAAAHALSCDGMTFDAGNCLGGLASFRQMLAKAVEAMPIPVGTPMLDAAPR